MTQGSPPRVRGKDTRSKSAYNSAGITPAYAGKSRCILQQLRVVKDHPRVCGEEVAIARLLPCLLGSPPRMRGRVCERLAPLGQWGDHPRVCGEESRWSWVPVVCGGSPPRMRGRALLHCTVQTWRGITPAYAGKRRTDNMSWEKSRDHPRVCGEEAERSSKWTRQNGSPPRMRGRGVSEVK